jgi:hypothetical protein
MEPAMNKNPILELPLHQVMRQEIALPLQHVLRLYTVGSFLRAWKNPRNHKSIEQVFDTPEQARHAAAICAAWLNVPTQPQVPCIPVWWRGDEGTGSIRH